MTITLEVTNLEVSETDAIDWFISLGNLPDVPGTMEVKDVVLESGEQIVF